MLNVLFSNLLYSFVILRNFWEFIKEFVKFKEADNNSQVNGKMTYENLQPPCT